MDRISTSATADAIIRKLDLKPHPEGGFYREIYRSDEMLRLQALNERYGADRSVATSIYYMLVPGTCSVMHRLKSDEIFHFYSGGPVEMLMLEPTGATSVVTLGSNVLVGQLAQHIVPRGVWQGCRLMPGSDYALLGCTVAPGFDFSDYEEGMREPLSKEFPEQEALISALTRK